MVAPSSDKRRDKRRDKDPAALEFTKGAQSRPMGHLI